MTPVPRDQFTVKEKLLDIRRRLLRDGRTEFIALLGERPTREEVVVTFLALLELVRDGFIRARQDGPDGSVIIERNKEEKNAHGEA